jgi:methyl-accepting chemotaxis protein
MSIKKLLVTVGIANFTVILFIFTVFITNNTRVMAEVERMIAIDQEMLLNLNNMYAQGLQTGQATRNIILNPDDAKAKENYAKAHRQFLQDNDELIKMAPTQRKETAAKIKALWEEDHKLKTQIQQFAMSGDREKAVAVLNQQETALWREIKDLILKQTKEQKEKFAVTIRETKQSMSNSNRILIILASISLILSFSVIFMLLRKISHPLSSLSEKVNRIAEGDLTVTIRQNSRDEIGVIAADMDRMVTGLKGMVMGIRNTSDLVASAAGEISANSAQLAKAANSQSSATQETSSTMVQMAASFQVVAGNADSLASNTEEVSSSIQELGVSSEQVAKSAESMASSVSETSASIEQMTVSIEKVAQNAEELASSVSETSSTIEQMTVSIDHVAGNTQQLQKVVGESAAIVSQMVASITQVANDVGEADSAAKLAAEEGAAGQHAVQEALAAMKRVAEVSEKTATSIINLGKRSEEIGNIVKVINEIADQTNLLALNAAIEAARAGDAGRGFAVVADEVRKLAERSINATKEIGQVIKQVQADTEDSVKYGELAAREAQASMELSGTAGNSLVNIVRSIEQTSELMSGIARMTGEQSNASTQMIKAVEKMTQAADEVASATREQAQGGKQIRIAVERMNHITREVTAATREQAQGSKQIRNAVETMNSVTGQVRIATREQSLSARQIVEAVNAMSGMTQSVADATAEQEKGGDIIVTAVENISDIARENMVSVEQLSRSTQSLSQQAVDLAGMVAQFKVC